MGTSLTNVAGVAARFLLAASALFFNGAHLLEPGVWTHPEAMEHIDTRHDGDRKAGFHAELTVGRGKRQVTVQLEFGSPRERSEDESL